MNNRQLPTDDDNADYVDSYKTDWKLYGLDELKVKLQEYKNTIETCIFSIIFRMISINFHM